MNPLILMDAGLLSLLLVIGVPVPFCFAGAVLLLMLFGDFGSTSFLIGAGFNKLNSIVLIAIPLYILAGGIMGSGGIATRLIDLADSMIGRLRGGLGLVLIVTAAVFGAISGMASSAVAAIGTVMIPRMVERGYDRGYAATLVAASSVLALLIPPSASMILYGWVTGTSILACFLAPIVPGLILVSLLAGWNMIMTRKMPIRQPEPAPLRQVGTEVIFRTKKAAAGLMMPLIILGFIYGGITTPTEAAAVAVVYAIPIAIYVYREMNWKDMGQVFWRAAQTSGVLMIMIFFASMLGRIWTLENVPQDILESFLQVSDNPIVLLLLANLFLMIIGMFMEDVSGILLAAPLLLPVMTQAGVDPIHFAAIIATNLGMGLITPPTAPLLYFAALIGKTSLSGMLKPALVFVLFAYLPVVLLTTFVPALSMWLPNLILGLN
ncbi:TRAP transporter large permease [Paracoccus sp. JM45]|uniref:TRAP transporter large permease n=1 Tax=Paracoccus sp. JM45 TaxID=2283626 RepID=UPI000E6BE75A|nr:TRAP transporter large permease [Paracoccus sp. JM45]RJE79118.1 TRAP transporter large permease [Paracoccus sp. JM45]